MPSTKTNEEWLGGGISYRQWRALRLFILNRDGWLCYQCGGPANTVDHVVPRQLGGSHHASNLRACCAAHNAAKRDRPAGTPLLSRVW